MKSNKKIFEEQEKINKELASIFKSKKIKSFRITSLGNSIASGYSMFRTTKPLLLRNDSLESIMSESNISLERFHFARAQNNSDEHIFEWLCSNILESQIHKLNINDYIGGKTSMNVCGLTRSKLMEYYPVDFPVDRGLKDVVLENGDGMLNVIIYNGCTGSLLDILTRKDGTSYRLMRAIKRDTYAIESTLKYIQANNRINGSNTQVYICGVPNFLGVRISEIINRRLKRIVKKYANTVYVESVKSKVLYKGIQEKESGKRFRNRYFDVHYDEDEYLEFNNNIFRAIKDNFQVVGSLINVDRSLYELSQEIEINKQDILDDKEKRKEFICEALESEYDSLDDEVDKKVFLMRFRKYFDGRYSHDFYYLGAREVYEVLNELGEKE